MVLAPGPRLACLPDAIHGEIFRELGDDASRAALYSSCTTFRESPAVNAQIDKLVVKRLQGGLERLSSFPRFARLQQLSMVACQATLEGAMGHSKTAQKARAVLETVEQLSLEVVQDKSVSLLSQGLWAMSSALPALCPALRTLKLYGHAAWQLHIFPLRLLPHLHTLHLNTAVALPQAGQLMRELGQLSHLRDLQLRLAFLDFVPPAAGQRSVDCGPLAALVQLRHLGLHFCVHVVVEGLQQVGSHCPKLESLELHAAEFQRQAGGAAVLPPAGSTPAAAPVTAAAAAGSGSGVSAGGAPAKQLQHQQGAADGEQQEEDAEEGAGEAEQEGEVQGKGCNAKGKALRGSTGSGPAAHTTSSSPVSTRPCAAGASSSCAGGSAASSSAAGGVAWAGLKRVRCTDMGPAALLALLLHLGPAAGPLPADVAAPGSMDLAPAPGMPGYRQGLQAFELGRLLLSPETTKADVKALARCLAALPSACVPHVTLASYSGLAHPADHAEAEGQAVASLLEEMYPLAAKVTALTLLHACLAPGDVAAAARALPGLESLDLRSCSGQCGGGAMEAVLGLRGLKALGVPGRTGEFNTSYAAACMTAQLQRAALAAEAAALEGHISGSPAAPSSSASGSSSSSSSSSSYASSNYTRSITGSSLANSSLTSSPSYASSLGSAGQGGGQGEGGSQGVDSQHQMVLFVFSSSCTVIDNLKGKWQQQLQQQRTRQLCVHVRVEEAESNEGPMAVA